MCVWVCVWGEWEKPLGQKHTATTHAKHSHVHLTRSAKKATYRHFYLPATHNNNNNNTKNNNNMEKGKQQQQLCNNWHRILIEFQLIAKMFRSRYRSQNFILIN